MSVSPGVAATVSALLGREPRGLEAVAVAGGNGQPVVIRVASLVDDRPFPTLFWLVDPQLCYRIDRAEADGLIGKFQARIDADATLRAAMCRDHLAHIGLRRACMAPRVRERLATLGFAHALERRGIGGIADFGRVRCLHTWYAAHLVVPNTIGRMLDTWWSPPDGTG